MTNVPILQLEWGIEGLKSAIARKDNIVIIDQIRFSCAVVTAVALGFIIEPTSDKTRKTESFSLSPSTFFNKHPQRVVITSSNGSYLSINAKGGKQVVYGCILNAKAVAEWLDKSNENATLLAAGEIDVEQRKQFLREKEMARSKENEIFALEDLLAAGAIAYFSKLNKSKNCMEAQDLFTRAKDNLLDEIIDTTSHRYNEARGKGKDTVDCTQLNLYNVVPKLHFIDGVPEITAD
jgi:2-phosphosulfolactate phosphatase